MKAEPYAELHCHSAFSFLDGASTPEELVLRGKALGLSALALTDHDDLGGIVRFTEAAKECGIDAIVGAELTMDDESHLTLLVKDVVGYKNLCYLISQARSRCTRGNPRVSCDDLMSRASGLVALSGCPGGRIPFALAGGREEQAKRAAEEMREIFGRDFFLEVWNHHVNQEMVIARKLLEIARHQMIPWVVTNNVHYATPAKRVIHDVLTCLRYGVTLATAGRRLRPNGSWYLKSPAEMTYLWRHNLEGVRNTQAVAERCQFRLGSLKPSLPVFVTPQGMTHNALLRRLVWAGAGDRYQRLTDKHIDQINHELELIAKLDLTAYFLIMWDIVNFAKSQGIAVQGRGSAANSAVCYCLAITAVDPIGMELLFERFLSEGRDEPPDIDLDIAHQEREKVLQYVYDKYGREHAAMVCEVITYRGKSAVRDACRVLDFSQDQADRLASLADSGEALDVARNLPNGRLSGAGGGSDARRCQLLMEVIAGLNGLPRHRSIHVGGFVLSGEPLGEMVPIEPASMPGRTVIQWDKDDLSPVGMIKIDLLGLGMLTMIQEGVKLARKHRGIEIDLARLNMSDSAIYEMLRRADTVGVFQVESRAQMNILPRLQPTCFYDIVVSIGLVRPGPIQGNIVHPYIRRRRGEEPVTYLHPKLEPVLRRTLGVPLFQEQGMRLAVVAAGFTPAESDQLRRLMSHKRSHERMGTLVEKLSKGMRANGFADEAIATVTQHLEAFASYGFPESHSASFALLAFASAYLKNYFAPEFYCALLNAQPMGFYSPDALVRDALRHGVEVRSVDLAVSEWDCTLEPRDTGDDVSKHPLSLRMGLRYVRGLGYKAKQHLELSRREGGSFTSMEDVCLRSGLTGEDLELLALAGAFETFCPGRRRALWAVLALAKRKPDLPLFKQGDLSTDRNDHSHRVLSAMTPLEETASDFKTQGLTTGRHPMTFYRSWTIENGIKCSVSLFQGKPGDSLTVAGAIIVRQRPATAKGFIFLTLEDETGTINVIVRPNVFAEFKEVIINNDFIAVTGKLQLEHQVANILAESIEGLPPLPVDLLLPSRNFH